jgi:hypothetical protein
MRQALAILLALAASACSWPAEAGRWERSTGRLETAHSVCSGTGYAKHAIVTTKHCVVEGEKQIRFQGRLLNIIEVMDDGGENVIILTDGETNPGAIIGPDFKRGDRMKLVGNAMGLNQALRRGYIAGFTQGPDDRVAFLLDCRCWRGDSGAGVFDRKGRLVAVLYGAHISEWQGRNGYPVEFAFAFAYPLRFTEAQWARARR